MGAESAYRLATGREFLWNALGRHCAPAPGMAIDLDDLERLTEQVIGCAIAVHEQLGPGLLESVYTECLLIELVLNGLRVERERQVPIVYRGQTIRGRLKVDLLVEGRVIIEVKAVEKSNPVFVAQLVTYLTDGRSRRPAPELQHGHSKGRLEESVTSRRPRLETEAEGHRKRAGALKASPVASTKKTKKVLLISRSPVKEAHRRFRTSTRSKPPRRRHSCRHSGSAGDCRRCCTRSAR